MDTHYRSLLPTPVVALLDRIEAFASREVLVKPNVHPLDSTDPNPGHLAAEVTEQHAAVLIRKDDDFTPHAALHELLHIERFWIEQVPQVVPRDASSESSWLVTGEIENHLEHLVIVPKEADYGFDPFSYWEETSRRNWGRYPWPEVAHPWARRKNCLLGWLTVDYLCKNPAVRAHAEACLKKESLLHEAHRFSHAVGKHMRSKERALADTIRFLKVPVQDVWLLVLDVRQAKCLRRPLAA